MGEPAAVAAPGRAAWRQLYAFTGVTMLLQIDGTLITMAVPAVGMNLGVSPQVGSLLLTAYFLPYALGLVPGGRFVDRYGSRRVALWGLGLFAVASVIGAVAPSFGVLVASRVVQGLAAGLASPAALAGAVAPFPLDGRGRALGVHGGLSGVAHLFGPALGGLLTVWFGWRANWWVLVPVALLCGYAVVRVATDDRVEHEQVRVPWVWHRVVVCAAVLSGLSFIVLVGGFLLGQQFLQYNGDSALFASLPPVVLAAVMAVVAPYSGRLADHLGSRRPIVAGFVLTGLGLAVIGLPGWPVRSGWSVLALVVVGAGLGLLFAPINRAALNAVPRAMHGRVSALLSGSRLIGSASGAALAGMTFAGGVTLGNTQRALLIGAAMALVVGVPLALGTGAPTHKGERT